MLFVVLIPEADPWRAMSACDGRQIRPESGLVQKKTENQSGARKGTVRCKVRKRGEWAARFDVLWRRQYKLG